MFVSVVFDCGGEDSAKDLANILGQYGFEKVQRACWESASITADLLIKLKKDIDRVTDYYDSVRLYQFPLDDNFNITILKQKKWRRIVVRPPKTK